MGETKRAEVKQADLAEIRAEAAPIVKHTVVVGILLMGSIVIGGILLLLELLFPKFAAVFEFLEKIDIAFLAGLFCLFVLYTTIIVISRLWRSVTAEFARKQSKTKIAPDEVKQ